jgi:hypothetical protein
MKLLSPKELNAAKESNKVKEILRVKELEEESDKVRKELANAEADFNSSLARNRNKWANEEQEHTKRVNEREQELKILEEKRLELLVPVDIITKGAKNRLEEANKFLETLREREAKAEELSEILQDKLDEVGEREQDVIKTSQELLIRSQSVDLQSRQVKNSVEDLNASRAEFAQIRKDAETDIQKRKVALFLAEQSVVDREIVIAEKYKDLEIRELQLADRQKTLAIAYREMERLSSPLQK